MRGTSSRCSLVILLVLCAGAAGCASDGGSSGRPAPSFSLERLNGEGTLANADLRGTTTVLNFWASWCAPCRKEMPALARFAAAHPDVQVVGIATSDAAADARAFAKKVGADYPLAIDPDGELVAAFGAPGLPATYLLDEDGRIVRPVFGEIDEKGLEELLAGDEPAGAATRPTTP